MTKPVIDHIGIIVNDLVSSVERLKPIFGDAITYRHLPEEGLKVAEFETQNLIIELLQYEGAAEFARDVMGELSGLSHITVKVDNVSESLSDLAAQGFQPQAGFPRKGAHGQIAFLERDDETNLLIEICEAD